MNFNAIFKNDFFVEDIVVKISGDGYYDENDNYVDGSSLEVKLKGSVSRGIERKENSSYGIRSYKKLKVSFKYDYILSSVGYDKKIKKGDIVVWNLNEYRISSSIHYPKYNFLNIEAEIIE